jgi:hypothetical protein
LGGNFERLDNVTTTVHLTDNDHGLGEIDPPGRSHAQMPVNQWRDGDDFIAGIRIQESELDERATGHGWGDRPLRFSTMATGSIAASSTPAPGAV